MDKKLNVMVWILALFFLACVLANFFIPLESFVSALFNSSISILSSFVAALFALLVIKELGLKSIEGKVWFFLTIGFFGWFIGQCIWTLFESVLNISPFPSLADVFFLLAYIPIMAGLFFEFSIIKENMKKNDVFKSLVITVIFAVASFYFVMIKMFYAEDYSLLGKVTSVLYPIGDILLLFPMLIFFFVYTGGKLSKSWLLISVGITIFVFTDTGFAYLSWLGLYSGIYSALSSISFVLGYLFIALGAYYHKLAIRGES